MLVPLIFLNFRTIYSKNRLDMDLVTFISTIIMVFLGMTAIRMHMRIMRENKERKNAK